MFAFVRMRGSEPNFYVLFDVTKEEFPGHSYAWTVAAPADQDLNRLHKLEDQMAKAAAALGAIHVGHRLGEGRLVVGFRSQSAPPSQLVVKTGLLSKTIYEVESREDRDWAWHEAEMSPTRVERHASINFPVHAKLEESGDDATLPRPIDYHLHFASEADAQRFLAELPEVFRSEKVETNPSEGRHWVHLVAEMPSDIDMVADCCANLEEIAERHGGELDGWESPIRQDN